jgi:(1->4)-alpha-D-glucan 1-alpha-D-glucosylmutase
LNSLSQTLIKLTAPGVPDTYQGNETWDFSLVDPDNRRPVYFQRLKRDIQDVSKTSFAEWIKSWETGRVKLAIQQAALKLRRSSPGLFTAGKYIPIEPAGAKATHIFSFARAHENRLAIVAVPRLCGQLAVGGDNWRDTHLVLPRVAHGRQLRNVFTSAPLPQSDGPSISAAELFGDCPVALLSGD